MRRVKWLLVSAALSTLAFPSLSLAQATSSPAAPGKSATTGASAVSPAVLDLSLGDAVAKALKESAEVRSAEAQSQQAEAQARSAWSNALPQFNTQLAYQRVLRSIYQGMNITIPDSMKFSPNSNAPLDERVKYLEDKTPNAAFGALAAMFSNIPFGRANTWIAGMTVTQPVFTGGRVSSGISMAGNAADAARYSLDETRSDIALQVKTGYYDAELAQRSVAIMQQSVDLAQEHLRQVKLRFDAGRASELDTLRAAVDLANLVPALQAARSGRDLALLNLKRLVRIPAEQELKLTTELSGTTRGGTPVVAVSLPGMADAGPELDQRGAMRAAAKAVDIRRSQVRIARAAFLPTLAFQGTLNRYAYPNAIRFPSRNQWEDDWNVAFAVSWPLFTGMKRSADLDAANAGVREAQVQLEQLRDGVRIQYQQALGDFERGKAQIDAAVRTSVQAQKVYDLTELRYGEGLATQLDVSSARLALQQARINEVQAYHDAYAAVARAERVLGMEPDKTTMP